MDLKHLHGRHVWFVVSEWKNRALYAVVEQVEDGRQRGEEDEHEDDDQAEAYGCRPAWRGVQWEEDAEDEKDGN